MEGPVFGSVAPSVALSMAPSVVSSMAPFDFSLWLQNHPPTPLCASEDGVIRKTQSACIQLRQTLVNQYNDVQYVEVWDTESASSATNLLSVSNLNPDKAWAIVDPSPFCVMQVQLFIPGSKVCEFGKPYLLSPKALRYFKTKPLYKEVAVISYQTVHWHEEVPVRTVYLLFKNKLKTTFDHFFAIRRKEETLSKVAWLTAAQPAQAQKEALIEAILKELGVEMEPYWFTLHGKWVIQKKYNPVIDYYSTVRTRVFTLNLKRNKIHRILSQLRVSPTLSNVNIRDTMTLQVRNQSSLFSHIMLFKSSDLVPGNLHKFMQPVCHNVLCRLYNKPTLPMNPSVKLFSVSCYPMYDNLDEETLEEHNETK
jgi:hypothetical protein